MSRKDNLHQSRREKIKKIYKKIEIISTILKTYDKFVIVATTSTSATFSVIAFGFFVIPIPTRVACSLTFSNTVLFELFMPDCDENEIFDERAQQTNRPLVASYRKHLHDNVIDEKEKYVLDIFPQKTWLKISVILSYN